MVSVRSQALPAGQSVRRLAGTLTREETAGIMRKARHTWWPISSGWLYWQRSGAPCGSNARLVVARHIAPGRRTDTPTPTRCRAAFLADFLSFVGTSVPSSASPVALQPSWIMSIPVRRQRPGIH